MEMVDSSLALEGIYFEGVAEPRILPRPRRPVEPRAPAAVTAAEQEGREFCAWLLHRARLPAESYRSRPLVRRVPACLRFLGVKTVAEARARVQQQPHLALELMDVLLLGVTQFRRDEGVFDQLGREILPALLSRQNRARFWSAACSDGQELYSLAMLVAEHGGLQRTELLGTDCRANSILDARAGRYPVEATAGLDPARRAAHFEADPRGVRVREQLRRRTQWKVADLLLAPEPGPWDLILWRNMAIYLEAAANDRLWQALAAELAPGGWLVTGKADHPAASLPLERVGPCLYRKAAP